MDEGRELKRLKGREGEEEVLLELERFNEECEKVL